LAGAEGFGVAERREATKFIEELAQFTPKLGQRRGGVLGTHEGATGHLATKSLQIGCRAPLG
jgi:hypothetical protein